MNLTKRESRFRVVIQQESNLFDLQIEAYMDSDYTNNFQNT